MSTFLVWLVTILGAVGPWFWLRNGNDVRGLLGDAALMLTATLGTVWLSRARAARRFIAAVDAYAEREIDRERRRNRPPRIRGVSILRGALPSGSPVDPSLSGDLPELGGFTGPTRCSSLTCVLGAAPAA
jgi:hypothetical protein